MPDIEHPFYPFDSGYFNGRPMMTMDSVDRCDQVAGFDIEQCQAALNNCRLYLQKTVRQKLEARIRRLQKSKGAA